MAVSPGRAAAAAFTGDVGLEGDEARSFALAPGLNQLISVSWQRENTRRGGRALESFCRSASEISDLHDLLFPKFHHSFLDCLFKER